jgi:hypothetical protein
MPWRDSSLSIMLVGLRWLEISCIESVLLLDEYLQTGGNDFRESDSVRIHGDGLLDHVFRFSCVLARLS